VDRFPSNPQLLEVLEQSRSYGFLGPGAVDVHVDHAVGFARAFDQLVGGTPRRVLDLGSGGGIPGLVLLACWPEATFTLLDASGRRCRFLSESIERLGWSDRAQVLEGRAEELGHRPALRGSFDLVVARSFGAPAVLAECAAGFLEPGGWMIVSEPPEGALEARWPSPGLHELGMGPATQVVEGSRFAGISLVEPVPERYPRRTGVPAKRPLF
jgi:16S rRNA (guanine527-N7)-methyltransferase